MYATSSTSTGSAVGCLKTRYIGQPFRQLKRKKTHLLRRGSTGDSVNFLWLPTEQPRTESVPVRKLLVSGVVAVALCSSSSMSHDYVTCSISVRSFPASSPTFRIQTTIDVGQHTSLKARSLFQPASAELSTSLCTVLWIRRKRSLSVCRCLCEPFSL